MRYEIIEEFEDIVAGAGGKTDKAQKDIDFLTSWSKALAEIISEVVNFFKELLAFFNTGD